MRLFRSKVWSFGDIVVLKVYCALLGLIVGAFIASFVKNYLWIFILVAAILLVRLFYFYFLAENRPGTQ